MARHTRGLYEALLTGALEQSLKEDSEQLVPKYADLRGAEAADRIALHVSRLLQRGLAAVPDKERVDVGVALAQRLVAEIGAQCGAVEGTTESPLRPGRVLEAMAAWLPDGTPEVIPMPLIPLLDTTLLTNAPGEPRVGSQLLTEIASADRIDVVMAFIRRSGIAPLLAALTGHCAAGRKVRVLTTTYTGSTEGRALDELTAAGAEIRISYDISSTRLHAKAWLFHRLSGFSTAYIGSSNLTHSAQVSGLEWNVRASGARNPDVIEKVAAVFESYWSGRDFVPYTKEEFLARMAESDGSGPQIVLSPLELRLEPFQERLLEQVALARREGRHRNLLVSATGTGKTVMAAVDYARLRATMPRARLLFVAHREEILAQSLATFRQAQRDHAFGELWVGGRRPKTFDHVFASIQSLSASGLAAIEPGHFDMVIVDEFHHAAANTYSALLEHLKPVELLGLTATPERSDGLPLLHWFDDRIAAELRLWDAIDQNRLAPFAYYGVHDGMDLRKVEWRRARGYDAEDLTNLLTADDAWARQVLQQLDRRVENLAAMRALGFCVSVEHARFMARVFQAAGINSVAVWSDTPANERDAALRRLASGEVKVVFSVDLFNEGVDVPTVDTLLLLRPTDSATLFLQQLGRGLRKSHTKTICTVLDFVGHHRKEFRFDRRLRALLGGSRKSVETQVEEGFPFLPAGCHVELDPVAREIVLKSIRESVPDRWSEKVSELSTLARGGSPVSLAHYLEETGCELPDVYTGQKSWSDLRADAKQSVAAPGPHEIELRRACGRLLHIDDEERLLAYRRFLQSEVPPVPSDLAPRQRRLLRMLIASILGKVAKKDLGLAEGCALVWAHPQVRAEVLELLEVLSRQVDHLHRPLPTHPQVPLQVHARYSRIEILAAFGVGSATHVAPWQSGVLRVEDERVDLLAFTLDKTSGQFSPTTRYRDYAVSPELIHWESQSTTKEAGETGLRYQRHAKTGDGIMLFARLQADDRAFWFLGPATYVSHESEMPMAVTWRLHQPLPGDLFTSFAAAVA